MLLAGKANIKGRGNLDLNGKQMALRFSRYMVFVTYNLRKKSKANLLPGANPKNPKNRDMLDVHK